MRKTVGKKRIRGRGVKGHIVIDEPAGPVTTDIAPKRMTRVVFTEPQRRAVEEVVHDYGDAARGEFSFADDVAMRNLRIALRNVTFEIDEHEKKLLLAAIDHGAFEAEDRTEGNLFDRARAAVEQGGS